jgi:hypothetical protein
MHTTLQQAIAEAFQQAEQARREHNSAAAFAWLERAHILTQRQPLLHVKSHWLMLTPGDRPAPAYYCGPAVLQNMGTTRQYRARTGQCVYAHART